MPYPKPSAKFPHLRPYRSLRNSTVAVRAQLLWFWLSQPFSEHAAPSMAVPPSIRSTLDAHTSLLSSLSPIHLTSPHLPAEHATSRYTKGITVTPKLGCSRKQGQL